ncbi:MAG: LUD domain-containing protein [Bacteroidales bacterium]|jgi:L-lactate dehydrogenase complex protein LldG|nr:LUD domain-containing protein [Bacteroidales bacterium]
MDEITSREKVLKSIRNSLLSKTPNQYSNADLESKIYRELDESLALNFAQEFTDLGGKFIYCEDEEDLKSTLKNFMSTEEVQPLFCIEPDLKTMLSDIEVNFTDKPENFKNLHSSITTCEFLIARFGSVMVSSGLPSGRILNFFSEKHLVVAYASQLVPETKDALISMREKYNGKLPSMITQISGASRTADIEKTLVMGMHGPKEIYVFFVDDIIE